MRKSVFCKIQFVHLAGFQQPILLLLTLHFSNKQAQVHTCTIVTTTKKSIKVLIKRGVVLGIGGHAAEKGEEGDESGFQVLLIYMALHGLDCFTQNCTA